MPGMRRSWRAPSSTTRTLGPRSLAGAAWPSEPPRPSGPSPALFSLALTSVTSSLTRRAAESGSVPTSATQSSPPRGAQCGSQRTQFHCGPAAGSAASTTMDRSRGLCSTAAWATSQRASARDASSGPARPTTPIVVSGIETGTQKDVGTAGSLASSAPTSWIMAGPSNSPIRIRSVSGSSARRSHSRLRGPVAVSSTCAGSIASSRRRFSSAALVCTSLVSTSAICLAYARILRRCEPSAPRCFRPLAQ